MRECSNSDLPVIQRQGTFESISGNQNRIQPRKSNNLQPFNIVNGDNVDEYRSALNIPQVNGPVKKAEPMNVRQPQQANEAWPKDTVRDEDVNFPGEVNFSFEQLETISSGRYNVGELKLKKDGTLCKINNHVGGKAWLNNVKLKPEENLAVRRMVYKCLANYKSRNPAISQQMLDRVRVLLLNERDRTSSLSRDEVKFLISMLNGDDPDRYTVANFEKLHGFKVGYNTDVQSVRGFIKGLAREHQEDEKAQRIAKAVSVNAQQSVVKMILNEIWGFLSGLFRGGRAKGSAVDRELSERGNTNRTNTYSNRETFDEKDMREVLGRVERDYAMPQGVQLAKNQPVNERDNARRNHFVADCKRDICGKLQGALKNYANETKPDYVLKTPKSHLRQAPGSKMSFLNCIINSVRHGGNQKFLDHLNTVFKEDSCTLVDHVGTPTTYRYSDFPQTDNGPTTIEQIIRSHINKCNKNVDDGSYPHGSGQTYPKLDASFGSVCTMLGLNRSDLDFGVNVPFENFKAVVYGDGADMIEMWNRFYNAVSDSLKAGSQVVASAQCSLVHPGENPGKTRYYSLTQPKLVYDDRGYPDGLKVHVVSDRPDGPNGEYEYDYTFRIHDISDADSNYSQPLLPRPKPQFMALNVKGPADENQKNEITA